MGLLVSRMALARRVSVLFWLQDAGGKFQFGAGLGHWKGGAGGVCVSLFHQSPRAGYGIKKSVALLWGAEPSSFDASC